MIIRLLKWLFGRGDTGPGYNCNGCQTWIPRSVGKAYVTTGNPGVHLYCPACAELKKMARGQIVEAKKPKDVKLDSRHQQFIKSYGSRTGRIKTDKPNVPKLQNINPAVGHVAKNAIIQQTVADVPQPS